MKKNITAKLGKIGADHAKVINYAIEEMKEKDTLDVPDGEFVLTSTITALNKGIRIEGRENTQFKVYHPGPAFVFDRNQSTSRTHISQISLMNHLNDNNSAEQHGIVSHVPIIIHGDVNIDNFHGNGLHLTADVTTSKARDVSFSKINSVNIRSCKGDGVYVAGGDSNGIILSHVGVWDNGGYGIHDNSFLGIHIDACMGHNNKKGHYRVSAATAHTVVNDCYGEGDSPASFFSGYTVVIGGLHENGVILDQDATFIKGRLMKNFRSGGIDIKEGEGITFGKEQVTYGLNLNLIKGKGGFPHYGMHHKEGDFWQFFGATKETPAEYAGRQITFASSGFQHLFIGSRLFIEGKKDEVLKSLSSFQFKAGDTILNPEFDGSNAKEFVFDGKEWKNVLLVKV